MLLAADLAWLKNQCTLGTLRKFGSSISGSSRLARLEIMSWPWVTDGWIIMTWQMNRAFSKSPKIQITYFSILFHTFPCPKKIAQRLQLFHFSGWVGKKVLLEQLFFLLKIETSTILLGPSFFPWIFPILEQWKKILGNFFWTWKCMEQYRKSIYC